MPSQPPTPPPPPPLLPGHPAGWHVPSPSISAHAEWLQPGWGRLCLSRTPSPSPKHPPLPPLPRVFSFRQMLQRTAPCCYCNGTRQENYGCR